MVPLFLSIIARFAQLASNTRSHDRVCVIPLNVNTPLKHAFFLPYL